MFKSIYKSWLSNFQHGGVSHTSTPVTPPRPPVAPPPAETPTTPTQTGGGTVGGNVGGVMPMGGSTNTVGMGAAGFFVAGFGADFFNQYNPMMSGLAQMGMGNLFNCGFGGGFGMAQGMGGMPQPAKMDVSSTDLKHCGFKKGTENTLSLGDNKFIDKGHGQLSIEGKNGEHFTVDINRCSAPPQIEIHAKGDKKKKAMMKVPLKDLQKGGSISLPDGTQLNMKANAKGNNMESFQVVSPDGQTATMSGFDKGNASWKTGGEAMKIEGPKLSANAGFDKITKGAAPNPGQIAQGNFNHLNPIMQLMQQFMNPMANMPGMQPMGGMPGMGAMPGMQGAGMGQNPMMGQNMMNPNGGQFVNPQFQQAQQMLGMVSSMLQLFSQLAQMFQQVGGSRFNMIR